MANWLIKSDPDEYSAADLARDGQTCWTGVRNPVAQKHIRAMQPDDRVLVYHTGKEKAIVATALVAAAPRPDATDGDGQAWAVDLKFEGWLGKPVTLAAVKADPFFADFALVRIGRLSVMPVTAQEWTRLVGLGQAR